ncbi:MAG TPA: hypothetical protein VJ850_03525 [Candidatus Limnocylindrales bacterium]|nr:hypothetical protein [Candidatus Limnocylindrales bacterium]
MSIDTTTPRSRRAILAGAIGGVLASVGLMSRPETAYAGSDGDVVLDAPNTGAGTTQIDSTSADPAFLVNGGGSAILGHSGAGVGVVGASAVAVVDIPDPIAPSTGVYGVSVGGDGVYGASDTGTAIHGVSNSGLGVNATSNTNNALRGHGALDGVIGESGGDKTGVVGYSGAGSAPQGPSKTGVYGESTTDASARGVHGKTASGQGVRGEATSGVGVQGIASSGAAIRGDAATGFALDATSTGGNGVRGTGGLDGVIGQSAGNKSGVVGFSGGAAPAGPANTGVYGEANQDATARGVSGKSTLGQAVRGETTTGVGVQAVATTGIALAATGKVTMNRSGKVTIPINVTSIDVTVPGGLSGTPLVFATLQYSRSGVWVTGARPNWPSTGKIRIYLNKGLATATPVAWMVLG